ncbi:hypothetical protein AAFF_G00372090 [Aldrovandia affinis]|uniref:Uncharacterized protein n=1 Tax=Aldrovandia affinis TaxID=143900 RepID=A0AAD7R548_9TELE|nr:hypothetical protein AAFF_G00372090 [Aldrovandia affinis]
MSETQYFLDYFIDENESISNLKLNGFSKGLTALSFTGLFKKLNEPEFIS